MGSESDQQPALPKKDGLRLSCHHQINRRPARQDYGVTIARRLASAMSAAGFVIFYAGLTLAASLLLALHAAVTISPPLNLAAAADVSTTVVDRDDRLLRAFTTLSGHWRLPVAPE